MTGLLLSLLLSQTSVDAGVAPPDAGVDVSAEELREIEQSLAKEAQREAEEPESAVGRAVSTVVSGIQSLNPDLSLVADVALAAFSDEAPLQTGGHDPTKSGFNLQQLELSLGASVDPYFRFDAYIVFSQFGVEVEEAYATTLALPFSLQARVGQFLTRFGRLNGTHPHRWDFVDQSFVLGRVFGGEGNRGLGVELSYLTPLPWYVEAVGSVTEAAGEGTARSFYGAEDGGVLGPLDFQFTAALKQFFPLSDDWSLAWGLSAANGPNSTGHRNRTDVYGTDLYLKFRPLSDASTTVVSLQAELLYRRRQVAGDVLQDWQGYGLVFWRFSQRWGSAFRYEFGSPARGLDGAVAEDPLDPEWRGTRQRLSANVTFWPTEFSRLRLQGSADLVPWRDRPIYAAFLAFEFSIGAHGSHTF